MEGEGRPIGVEPRFSDGEPPPAPDRPRRRRRSNRPRHAAPPREPLFYADTGDGADLQNIGEAIAAARRTLPALGEAQTPFLVGVVGPSGSGKSFALRRLARNGRDARRRCRAKTPRRPFVSRILVVADRRGRRIGGDPASAIASAAFAALERGRDGVNYAALADEAAHAGVDPQRAAAIAAAERHDEIGQAPRRPSAPRATRSRPSARA